MTNVLHYSIFSLLASALGASSVFLLYRSWKQRAVGPRTKLLTRVGALSAASASLVLLILDIGPEIAIPLCFLILSISAWLCVLWESYRKGQWRPSARSPGSANSTAADAPTSKPNAPASPTLYKLNAFAAAGPLAGLAAAFLSMAVTHFMGLDAANQFVLSGFLFPVFWSGLAVWACADSVWWRPTLGSFVSMALAYLVIQL